MLHQYFSANSRLIFLIDGLGALLSTLLLLLIARFEEVFGMPKDVLYWLVPVTTIFTTYSLGSYLLNPKAWKRFLIPMAIANILYCSLTLVLLVYHFERLTVFGIAYFFAEILLILLLSRIELGLTKA